MLFFFKRDRENAYLLFTFFALPGLLWLVYYWEKTQTIFSPTFRELHPELFSGNFMDIIFTLQNQLLSMTQQPILLIGFVIIFGLHINSTKSVYSRRKPMDARSDFISNLLLPSNNFNLWSPNYGQS